MRRALAGLASAAVVAGIASPGDAQPPPSGREWTATPVVIAIWPMPDDAAADRAAIVARAIATAWLPEHDVTLTRTLTEDPADPAATALLAFMDCNRRGSAEEEPLEASLARLERCRALHPFGGGMPLHQVVRGGTWTGADERFVREPSTGWHSPAATIAEAGRVGGTTFVAIVSGTEPPRAPREFESEIVVDVGDGPWDVEQAAAALAETCRRLRAPRRASCTRGSIASGVEVVTAGDRTVTLTAAPDAAAGFVADVAVTGAREEEPPEPPAPNVVLAMPGAPAIRDPGLVTEGRSVVLQVTVPEEEVWSDAALHPHAELDGRRIAVDQGSPWAFALHLPRLRRPGAHTVDVWLEADDGRTGPRGRRVIEVVERGPTLTVHAGRTVCRDTPTPTPPNDASLRIHAAGDRVCFEQPWWSLERESHVLYAPHDGHRMRTIVRVRPSASSYGFVGLAALLLALSTWVASFRPTARWLARRRSRHGGFRESAEAEWTVTAIDGDASGPLHVRTAGPFAWARAAEDHELWDGAVARRVGRVRPGLTATKDGEIQAVALDDEAGRAVRDGRMEAPTEVGTRGPSRRLTLVGGVWLVALVPPRVVPALESANAMMIYVGVAGAILVGALLVTRLAAKRW